MTIRLALDMSAERLTLLAQSAGTWFRLGEVRLAGEDLAHGMARLARLGRMALSLPVDRAPPVLAVLPESEVERVALPMPVRHAALDPDAAANLFLQVAPQPLAGLRLDWRRSGEIVQFAAVPLTVLAEAEDFLRAYGFEPAGSMSGGWPAGFDGTPWFGRHDEPAPRGIATGAGGQDLLTLDRRRIAANPPEAFRIDLAAARMRAEQAARLDPVHQVPLEHPSGSAAPRRRWRLSGLRRACGLPKQESRGTLGPASAVLLSVALLAALGGWVWLQAPPDAPLIAGDTPDAPTDIAALPGTPSTTPVRSGPPPDAAPTALDPPAGGQLSGLGTDPLAEAGVSDGGTDTLAIDTAADQKAGDAPHQPAVPQMADSLSSRPQPGQPVDPTGLSGPQAQPGPYAIFPSPEELAEAEDEPDLPGADEQMPDRTAIVFDTPPAADPERLADFFTPPPGLSDAAQGASDPFDFVQPGLDAPLGADALALAPQAVPRDTPAALPVPPPADQTWPVDDRGLVLPAPQGRATPEGILVFSGPPDQMPGRRPEIDLADLPEVAPEPVDRAALDPDDPLLRAEPRRRPAGLAERAERAQLGGRTRAELTTFRPRARPASIQDMAEAAQAAAAPTLHAIAIGPRPSDRPDDLAQRMAAAAQSNARDVAAIAAASTAAISPPEPSRPTAPAVASGQSPASVSQRATQSRQINLTAINLLGTFGNANDLRALVRMPDGGVLNVSVGDRMDGGRVQAIGRGRLTYVKRGQAVVLDMPSG